jgi:hypothetical protein
MRESTKIILSLLGLLVVAYIIFAIWFSGYDF